MGIDEEETPVEDSVASECKVTADRLHTVLALLIFRSYIIEHQSIRKNCPCLCIRQNSSHCHKFFELDPSNSMKQQKNKNAENNNTTTLILILSSSVPILYTFFFFAYHITVILVLESKDLRC